MKKLDIASNDLLNFIWWDSIFSYLIEFFFLSKRINVLFMQIFQQWTYWGYNICMLHFYYSPFIMVNISNTLKHDISILWRENLDLNNYFLNYVFLNKIKKYSICSAFFHYTSIFTQHCYKKGLHIYIRKIVIH